jgi:chorismate--pyruvate lyase
MLTRSLAPAAHTPVALTPAGGKTRLPVSPRLRRWLAAQGSLTARLRLHGIVTVDVLSQGRQPLLPQERRALGCEAAHVREVLLCINGRAAVWARSVTGLKGVKGPWASIKGLGKRPLAELLFNERRVTRHPIRACHLRRTSPLHQRMTSAWLAHAVDDPCGESPMLPRWARHSLFWHRGAPLQVLEAFAPWLAALCCGRQ